MVSPGNRHCANCIGTLSFPMACATHAEIGAWDGTVSGTPRLWSFAVV